MADDKQPALGVYSVDLRDRGANDWIKVGTAVPHEDGRGYDIMLQALPLHAQLVLRAPAGTVGTEDERLSLAQQVEAFERAVIEQCLMETGGKISAVLGRLNIPRRTLNEKMSRLGIDRRRLTNNVGHENAGKSLKIGKGPLTR
jgi:Bacterial regulatory protein, Fis family